MSNRAAKIAARERKLASREEFHYRREVANQDKYQLDHIRDSAKAATVMQGADDEFEKIIEAHAKRLEADLAATRKPYEAKVRELLTADAVKFTGATHSIQHLIPVTHWKVSMPEGLQVKMDSKSFVAGLRPGGGLKGKDTAANIVDKALQSEGTHISESPEFVTWAEEISEVWRSVIKARYAELLATLRDDDRMAELFTELGLVRKTDDVQTFQTSYGEMKRKLTVIEVPTLTGAHIERDGMTLTYALMLGHSAKLWSSKADKLAAVFASLDVETSKMSVEPASDGSIKISFHDIDPLDIDLPQIVPEYDSKAGRIYLGQAADGSDVHVTLKDNGLTLFAGIPGSGKTGSLMPLIAGLVGHAEVRIIDCGASGEWDLFEPVCESYDDTGDITAVSSTVNELMRGFQRRMAQIKSRGDINFWRVPVERRERAGLHPIVLVIEEAPVALAASQSSKERKDAAATNRAVLGEAARTLRKAGITIWVVGQKFTDDMIPTSVRDMAHTRVCFRVDSIDPAVAVLGDTAHSAPRATDIAFGKQGRFVARADARGNILGQAVFVPLDGIAARLHNALPVPPQYLVGGPENAPSAPEPKTTATPAVTDDEDDW